MHHILCNSHYFTYLLNDDTHPGSRTCCIVIFSFFFLTLNNLPSYQFLSSPLFLPQMHQRCDCVLRDTGSYVCAPMLIYSSICVSVHNCVRFSRECVLVCQCVPSLSGATGITWRLQRRTVGLRWSTRFTRRVEAHVMKQNKSSLKHWWDCGRL